MLLTIIHRNDFFIFFSNPTQAYPIEGWTPSTMQYDLIAVNGMLHQVSHLQVREFHTTHSIPGTHREKQIDYSSANDFH